MRRLILELRRWLSTGFLGDVVKLVTGTLLARVITIATLPVVTRLYSPEDFTLLATYMSLLSLIGVIACFRLDIAIPLAENEDDAVQLMVLAMFALMLVVCLSSIAVFSYSNAISELLGKLEIAPHLWLLPVGVAMVGTYSIMQHWFTRLRRFAVIARTRVIQAFMGVTAMLSFGWTGITPLGLLLGNALNVGAGGIGLGFHALRSGDSSLGVISFDKLKAVIRKYYHYIVYSTPEAFLNVFGVQVPILLIAAHGEREAGFLFLAMQVTSIPMKLLGSSISQVYVSRAPQRLRDGELSSFTLLVVKRLLLIGAGPLVLVGVFSPVIFPWLFGVEWTRAGEIVPWLVPYMLLQFLASPVSMVMMVTQRQRQLLLLRILTITLRVGALFFAITCLESKFLVELFAIVSALNYGVLCAIFIGAANKTQVETEKKQYEQ